MINNIFVLMAGPDGQGNPLPTFIFMGAIFVVMYFFMIRPQSKKAKDQKKFIDEIQKGDKVVTIGGIHGRVAKVNDDSFLIEVDSNTKLKIEKSVVSMDFTKAAQSSDTKPKENNQ